MTRSGKPFIASTRAVRDEWIDYNGHFNMAYYCVLFDEAIDEAFAHAGLGPDYIKQTNCSYFTLEAHISYLRELHAGDKVSVSVQVLDYDAKRVHYIQEMHHAGEGWLSATMEALCMHIDMSEKKAAPFPDDMRKKFAAMYEDHKGLAVPKQAGHTIGIRRKVA